MIESITMLYFADCPGWRDALTALEAALAESGVTVAPTLTPVETDEEAARLDFHGSPTIRVNGRDIASPPPGPPALACRTYRGADGRMRPAPPVELIRAALRDALAAEPA